MMDLDRPAVKRQKISNGIRKADFELGTSRLFTPYRTVGLISPTAVPFTTVPRGKTTFQITTSIGYSLQTYDLRSGLQLVFITRPQTPELITASAAWKDRVLAAWGRSSDEGQIAQHIRTAEVGVWIFERGKKIGELDIPQGWKEKVSTFCVFGSWIVGVAETQLLVWKSSTLELYTILQGISPVALTSCISSLPTMLNKILVGRQDGTAEIWNVSSGKLIYTILPPSTTYGALTAIEPTPALSLVALAYRNGSILLHDVRTDETVIRLNASAGIPVTSISFRTDSSGAGDDGRKAGVMATASNSSGDVTLWDLNEGGRKAGVLRAAHASPTNEHLGGVNRIEFLAGQAILVSSGLDNSLKTWIFDQVPFDPVPRILHQRSGHGAPITKLLFLPTGSDGADDTGKWLLSASGDRSLWGWSLRRDGQSTELSQGAIQSKAKKQGLLSGINRDDLDRLKCPPITAIASSLNRDGGIGALPGKQPIWQSLTRASKTTSAEVSAMTGWESVVTGHEDSNKARTWFWGRKRAGRWAFQTSDEAVVTSIAMSPCGTFAVVGSAKGSIDCFNLQSGIHRQRFPVRLTPTQAKQLKFDVQRDGLAVEGEGEGQKQFYRGQGKHGSAVVGLAVDTLNKTLISAGGDGKIRLWNFITGLLSQQLDWSEDTSITTMKFHRESSLAAFACSIGCIRMVDVSTGRLVRELWPSRPAIAQLTASPIHDICFSNDGRWIVGSIRAFVFLWDLPTGHLIDVFRLKNNCTALSFSPTGEFLATATTDSFGVDIWTNRSIFSHVPTRHIDAKELEAIVISDTKGQAPTASGDGGENLLGGDNLAPGEGVDHKIEDDPDQLTSSLVSLSLVPRSRWQNLLHLDLIRQRNRPTEAPQKPQNAPFFLPSLNDGKSNTSDTTVNVDTERKAITDTTTKVLSSNATSISQFSNVLQASMQNNDLSQIIAHLKTLSPAAADVELRSLSHLPSTGRDQTSEAVTLVHALTSLMKARSDFELNQAWMAVFLRLHGDVVTEDAGLRDAIVEWRDVMVEEKRRVGRLARYGEGVVGYLRAARV